MKAVIVAAGRGSRLMNNKPKTMIRIGGKTILEHILSNLSLAGIKEFIIVVGYQAPVLQNFLVQKNHFGLNIQTVYNKEWQRGNGISVLSAEEAVQAEPFILSMSDHIVSPSALQRIVEATDPRNLLLVDRNVQRIFDIDDATKVQLNNERIIKIGKEITDYNGIDCGIFKLKPNFFEAMRKQLKKGQESISAAVRELITQQEMAAVFMNEQEFWIDIDTPEAFAFAEQNLQKFVPYFEQIEQ